MIQRPVSTNSPRQVPGPRGNERPRWVIRPVERPAAALRLFCFPFAGVGASSFRGWTDLLPDEIEVAAVQLPGRESRLREPCVTKLTDAVAGVMSGFEGLLDRPFALFGHSLGARRSHISGETRSSNRSPGDTVVSHRRFSRNRSCSTCCCPPFVRL